MLRIAAPHVEMWNTWYVDYGNQASNLGPLLALVDDACAAVGRDPGAIERTVAAYGQSPRGMGRPSGSGEQAEPFPIAEAAEKLAELEAAGIGHVQMILDPIDARSVEELATALEGHGDG
jgi:hypothetical protein